MLHNAAWNPDADFELFEILLKTDAIHDLNTQCRPQLPAKLVYDLVRCIVRCCGSRNKLLRFLASVAGATPLHFAAFRGDVSLCTLLCSHGADPSLRNRLGMTPLEFARYWLSGRRDGPVPEALVRALSPGAEEHAAQLKEHTSGAAQWAANAGSTMGSMRRIFSLRARGEEMQLAGVEEIRAVEAEEGSGR